MDEGCLFCSIAEGSIGADLVLDEPDLLAFRDIAPQAPVHVLVIPRRHLPNIGAVAQQEPALAARLLSAAADLAAGLSPDSGFRLVTNTGPEAGQTVDHAHVHLLAGRPLTWPPG